MKTLETILESTPASMLDQNPASVMFQSGDVDEEQKNIFLAYSPLKNAIRNAGWKTKDFKVSNGIAYLGSREIIDFNPYATTGKDEKTFGEIAKMMASYIETDEDFLTSSMRNKKDKAQSVFRGRRANYEYKINNNMKTVELDMERDVETFSKFLEKLTKNENKFNALMKRFEIVVETRDSNYMNDFLNLLNQPTGRGQPRGRSRSRDDDLL